MSEPAAVIRTERLSKEYALGARAGRRSCS